MLGYSRVTFFWSGSVQSQSPKKLEHFEICIPKAEMGYCKVCRLMPPQTLSLDFTQSKRMRGRWRGERKK